MQNLKIRVNSKAESKEVMSLLDTAGYTKGIIDNISKPCWIAVLDGKEYSDYMLSKSTWYTANPIEINLPELRDLVVLKRNDVNDATHENSIYKYFKACDGWYYFDLGCTDKWQKSAGEKPEYYEKLKPIEKKEMKEYLIPDRNYEYILTDAREGLETHAKDWIEIPEGAECLTKCKDHNNDEWLLFWKDDYKFCVGHDKEWFNFESGVNEYLDDWRGLANIIWQREQDEPFLTPECTLNDQYAEIEKVRQHKKHERNSSAWDTQVGGNHYKQFKIQPMQFALENKLDAAQQNVIKYIMRHSFKNGKQDLEKAKHYIDLMIEFYYGDNNNG